MTIRKFVSKAVNAVERLYTGKKGELTYDPVTKGLYLEDGVTPGGNALVQSVTNLLTGGITYSASGVTQYLRSRSPGIKCALIGDSIAANCSSNTSQINLFSDIRSWVHWGIAFHGGDLVLEPVNNYGLTASTSAYALTQVPAVIASGVQVCFIQTGINDPAAPIALSDSLLNMKKIVEQLKAAGVVPVIRLNSPDGGVGWTAAYMQQSMAFNEELKAYYGNPGSGVGIHDPYPLYVDTTSATSAPRSTLVAADLLHPVGVGAALEGPSIANVLTSLGFPVRRIASWGQGESFDKTGNTRGNLLNNNAGVSYGALAGTSGTKGANVTGNVATGWDVSEISGTTAVAVSIEATAINVNSVASGATYNRQVIAATFVGGETVRMRTSFNPVTNVGRYIAVGDVLYAEVECEVLSADAAGGVSAIALIANEGGATCTSTGLSNQAAYTALLPISNRGTFVIRTPLTTLITGVVGYIVDIQFAAAAGTTGVVTVKVGEPRLLKASAFTMPAL